MYDRVDVAVGVFDGGEEPVDLPVDGEIGDDGGCAATAARDVPGDPFGRLRSETVCDDVESMLGESAGSVSTLRVFDTGDHGRPAMSHGRGLRVQRKGVHQG